MGPHSLLEFFAARHLGLPHQMEVGKVNKRPKNFRMKVNLENAAFEDDDGELQRILEHTAKRIGRHNEENYGTVRDINGNAVGEWKLK